MACLRRINFLIWTKIFTLVWLILKHPRSLDFLKHLFCSLWVIGDLACFFIRKKIFRLFPIKWVLLYFRWMSLLKQLTATFVGRKATLVSKRMFEVSGIRFVCKICWRLILNSRFQIYCYVLFFLGSCCRW